MYGATSGKVYFSGNAGERFAVRNSGAQAVVEGLGDHGCEYMTGGRVLVLGSTGKNFAAGMSGGIAYVLDENKDFKNKCNLEMVGLEKITNKNEKEWLKNLLLEHYNFTNSEIAKRLLNIWEKTLSSIIKVMPKEYKLILEQKKTKAA